MFAQLEILLEKETQRDKQRVSIKCTSAHCQSNRFCIGFHFVSLRFSLLTYLLWALGGSANVISLGELTAVYYWLKTDNSFLSSLSVWTGGGSWCFELGLRTNALFFFSPPCSLVESSFSAAAAAAAVLCFKFLKILRNKVSRSPSGLDPRRYRA